MGVKKAAQQARPRGIGTAPAPSNFPRRMRELVDKQAPALCAFRLEQMDRALAEGWRCFYVQPTWVRENTPAPHLNDLGRRYMEAEFITALHTEPGKVVSDQPAPFLSAFFDNEATRASYRNLFALGTLDVEQYRESGAALDQTVNDCANRLLHEQDRHAAHEWRYNRAVWYVEALAKGTLTPPAMVYQLAAPTPVRDPALPIEEDSKYWHAKYFVAMPLASDYAANRDVMSKPDCTLALMAQLAPDFPYAAQMSTIQRLVFVQEGDSALAWAIVIGKPSGAGEYSYPPRLVLIARSQARKLQDKHILFADIMPQDSVCTPMSPREVEIAILYYVPRLRRLIDFYQPFVAAALTHA